MSNTPEHIDLSLVVACYNEEPHLEDSVREVCEVLDDTCWTYELIFVEDCSRDRTREIVKRLVAERSDGRFRMLLHEANTGRGRTVSDGMRIARGDVVGFIDIDLEVHARYIPSCVNAIHRGYDVATGLREYKVRLFLLHRWILSKGYVWLVRRLLGTPLHDTESGFKFFSRERVLSLLEDVKDAGWFWDTEIMEHAYCRGYRIIEIPCLFIRRADKKSTVRLFHDSCVYFWKLMRFRKVVAAMRRNRELPGPLEPRRRMAPAVPLAEALVGERSGVADDAEAMYAPPKL